MTGMTRHALLWFTMAASLLVVQGLNPSFDLDGPNTERFYNDTAAVLNEAILDEPFLGSDPLPDYILLLMCHS